MNFFNQRVMPRICNSKMVVATISVYCFANYIKIFHKNEVPKIILRRLTCLNPNCIKSYDIIFYSFVKIIFENLCLINGHFKTIFGHFSAKYIYIFHKNEALAVKLRCLVCLILNWIKSYDTLQVKMFFSCLQMHYFRGSLRE